MPTDLKTQIKGFNKWLSSDSPDAANWQKGREERLAWYRKHLTREHVTKLTQEEFSTLIKGLWAVNIWHNKDYKVQKLIEDNGLEKIRSALKDLLYDTSGIDARWDAFRATIKGLGPSSLSEILTFFDPQQHALVNLKPYEVLPRIGYSIAHVTDGKSYKRATEELAKVKLQLANAGIQDADFILTDFFIAYLFYEVFELEGRRKSPIAGPLPPASTEEPAGACKGLELTIATHESAEAVLLMLGKLLGYDTYTPDASRTYDGQKLGEIATLDDLPPFASEGIMDSARNIDVVWLKEEYPECFFEVEHTTGVTPGLLRIYQAQKVNAKFFIVGPKEVLRRYEREVQKAPFKSIKEKYCFRSYEELRDMYLAAAQFSKISKQFLG